MQTFFSGRYSMFIVSAVFLFVPMYFWTGILRQTGMLSITIGNLAFVFGVFLLFVIMFEMLQRLANRVLAKSGRLSKIQNTGQHTLLVMAISLATKFNIPIPYLIVRDDYNCNAMMVPIFNNCALFINDKLINALTPDELKAVIAHEYAHISLGHVEAMSWLNSLLQISLVMPAKLLDLIFKPVFILLRLERFSYTTFCLILLISHAAFLFVYVNYINRKFERQADREAIRYVSAKLLIKALQALQFPGRINVKNNSNLFSKNEVSHINLFYRFLQYFHSHPSISSRIQLLQAKE